MGEYKPEFREEFTATMRYIMVGERIHNDNEPVPEWHPDIPVGTVASWPHIDDVVIVRVSETTWQFKARE